MIITIGITEAAIEYLIANTGLEHETAEEVAQTIVSLCDKSGSLSVKDRGAGYRIRRSALDLIEYRRRDGIRGDMKELELIHELERAIEEEEKEVSEESKETKRAEDLADSIWEAYSALVENGIRAHLYKSLREGIEALAKKPGLGIRRAARDLIITASGYIKSAIPSDVWKAIETLDKSLIGETELSQAPEPEDLLFKTADSLMRYYAENGSDSFRSRFGSLDVLKTCRKIIREGEGSPHPWEEE